MNKRKNIKATNNSIEVAMIDLSSKVVAEWCSQNNTVWYPITPIRCFMRVGGSCPTISLLIDSDLHPNFTICSFANGIECGALAEWMKFSSQPWMIDGRKLETNLRAIVCTFTLQIEVIQPKMFRQSDFKRGFWKKCVVHGPWNAFKYAGSNPGI